MEREIHLEPLDLHFSFTNQSSCPIYVQSSICNNWLKLYNCPIMQFVRYLPLWSDWLTGRQSWVLRQYLIIVKSEPGGQGRLQSDFDRKSWELPRRLTGLTDWLDKWLFLGMLDCGWTVKTTLGDHSYNYWRLYQLWELCHARIWWSAPGQSWRLSRIFWNHAAQFIQIQRKQ